MLSSSTNTSDLFVAASAGPFSFSFKTWNANEIEVVKRATTGVETTLTYITDYTVSLNADQDANPGGTYTLTTALVSGEKTRARRVVAATQGTDIQNAGGFLPEVIESALDKITALCQQNAEEVARCVKVDLSSTETPDAMLDRVEALVASAAALDITYVSPFMATVLDDTTAAAARTTLGARGEADDVILAAGKKIIFEGTTDDAFEGTLDPGNPTADVTWTFPDKSGTVAMISDIPGAELPSLAAGDVGKSVIVGAGPAAAVGSSVTLGTAQALTSGTEKSWDIPSWLNSFTLTIHDAALSASALRVVVGVGGGKVTSGYHGNNINFTSASYNIVTLASAIDSVSASTMSGSITFWRVSGNTWAFRGELGRQASQNNDIVFGSIALGGALDKVYLTSASGTATFTNGSANVQGS